MKNRIFPIILCVLVIGASILFARCSNASVKVPDVTGMTQADAEQTIKDAGLVMVVSRERFSDTVAEGSIATMDTKADTELNAGDEVKVAVSRGKGVMVPGLNGLTGKEAENLLNVLGLHPIMTEESSDDVPEGNVISYTDGGSTLPVGSDVTVTVSSGPQS